MKILIVGNLGYIGPLVVRRLRSEYKNATLIGYDIGYFAHCLTEYSKLPESSLNIQYFGDVREFPSDILKKVDYIIYLAAISNDPMGKEYSHITWEVNCFSAIKLATIAKNYGVSSFVYASTCSIYGFAEEGFRTEESEVNPLTAYSKSKISAEAGLKTLSDNTFKVTCLRFATACGMSPRLRLDLVLNDFVASALATGKIEILSDGTPWRPLIHVEDMARAIDWAIARDLRNGGPYLVVNVGSKEWNYQIKKLAEMVHKVIPDTEIFINSHGLPDKRSYRVDFSLFKRLAPEYTPKVTLEKAVKGLLLGLKNISFSDRNFRNSNLIRLKMLNEHRQKARLSNELKWIDGRN